MVEMSGNKQETKSRLDRTVEWLKRNRGRIAFLAVSMILLCLITLLPGNKKANHAGDDVRWERVEQEGLPCIVIDEQGSIVGTKRGELLRRVVLDYTAVKDNRSLDCQNYQIRADAFSDCPNLRTLILPTMKTADFLNGIDENAFRGCSDDLVVYCNKDSYAWTRLGELGITVRELPEEEKKGSFMVWHRLGQDEEELKRLQEKVDSEQNNSRLTDQEMLQLYGEPFFLMTESGELPWILCDALSEWADRQLYLPAEARSIGGTFANYIMQGTSLTVPKNMTEIGNDSFMCCEFSEITFEEGSKLKSIGSNAFLYQKITELNLPEGLQVIGKCAFMECSDLREITIPESVQTVEDSCFSGCTSLERVIVRNPDITFGKNVFPFKILNPERTEEIDIDHLDSNFIRNDKLTIVCHKGSAAEKNARKNGVRVEYLD